MYLDLSLSEFCSLFYFIFYFFGDVLVVLIEVFSHRDFVNRIFLGACVGLTLCAS